MRSNRVAILLILVIILIVLAFIFVPGKEEKPVVIDSNQPVVAESTQAADSSPANGGVVSENLLADEQLKENPMELQIETITQGQGAPIATGQTAVVHYTGWLTDGTKFDSSVDRGTLFEFTLGAGQVIPGWDQGVLGMKVGEKRKLTVPSNLAYGDAGVGPIPGKATLVFEVELLAIK